MRHVRLLWTNRARLLRGMLGMVMSLSLVLGGAGNSLAALEFGTGNGYEELQVLKGDIQTIRTAGLKRVSITDPAIADINDARAGAVEIMGVAPGQTTLFIWEETGKRTVVIRVVTESLDFVRQRIESLLASAEVRGLTINGNATEGKVVITGIVPEDKADVVKGIVDPFGDRVINLTQKQKVEDLIQIDAQVTELNTTLSKVLGVDWTVLGGDSGTLPLIYNEDETTQTEIPRQNGSFKDLFKLGSFSRTTGLVATVNAMISEGKGKILSKPRVVVVSGKEATFMVGGQIPIRTLETSTTGTVETTTYKDYGIQLTATPTIKNGKMIGLELNVTISDVDTSDVKGNESGVAFLTRSAKTSLLLEDKQTIVLAGLIKNNQNETVNRVAGLSRIPFLGALFRSKNLTPNKDTEVVISITPTILRGDKKAEEAPEAEEPKIDETPAGGAAGSDETFEETPAAEPVAVKVSPKPVPVISKAPEVSVAGRASEMYAATVQQKILSAIAFPYEAQEQGWQGTVKLTLVLEKDGTLQSVVVKESSGYEVFDQDALNTAQILAPYAAFPSDVSADTMTLMLPVVYSLDEFLQNVDPKE